MIRRALAGLTLAVSLAGLLAPAVHSMNVAEYAGRHRAPVTMNVPAFASPADAGAWRMAVRATV